MAEREDPMGPAEGLLPMMTEERYRLARLGLPRRRMARVLHEAITAYRRAEAAGDERAMAVAREEAERVVREELVELLAATLGPPGRAAN